MANLAIAFSSISMLALFFLFSKRFRKRAFYAFLASMLGLFAISAIERPKLDKIAKETGFLDHSDFMAAKDEGIVSPTKWKTIRVMRQREHEALREKAEKAEGCGKSHFVSAFVMSQRSVKATLKAPSTAIFPSINSVQVSLGKNCTYIVNGYVDAQNSFGAQIRTNYWAIMRHSYKNETWSLVKFKM